MASSYITPQLETDADALAQDAFDHLSTVIPGWVPSPGDPATILIEAIARQAAENREVASAVIPEIFRWAGARLYRVPPQEATQAVGTSTWTMIDDAGYSIPAGTQVGITVAGDQQIPFKVSTAVVVAPGDTATNAGEVILIAVDPGGAASGLTGPAELLDTLTFVDSVALVGSTSGGVDAEDNDTYLDRLASELQLLAPRPILPADFEIMARRIAGVDRALALDGYNPDDQTYNNERFVSVAVIDSAGQPLSSPIKAQVDTLLQSEREVNFVVRVIDPTSSTVDVDFTAVALTGFDETVVEAAAIQAVTDYLSPQSWGLPEAGEVKLWIDRDTVRYLEVASVIDRVEGLDYISTLGICAGGGTPGTSDVSLDAPAPLPDPGAITGVVSAP